MVNVWRTLLQEAKPITDESIEELLNDLNGSEDLSEQFQAAFSDMEAHFDAVCADCGGITEEKTAGDEGWTVCPDCQNIEQTTYEVSYYDDFRVYFNHNLKKWIKKTSENF